LKIPKSPAGAAGNLAQYNRPAVASPSRSYTVRKGDNLSRIAAQNKVSVADLKRWNRLSSNALKIGQNISLTANNNQPVNRTTAATFYKVRAGDSLYGIAKRHKISLKQLQNWNPKVSTALKPGQTLALYL
ncbi:MAG: LysM peptidoglycan-binding domain-containing protein, partial [Thiopseudomonas sp.]|nr:LysM peptidoglycan-binding domain-containing protein [Thiopseudomonas sp.]